MKKPVIVGLALALTLPMLAGCGYSRGDRALSGGAIGAAGGAALTAVTGGPVLAGAAVGAAAGAVAGAVTKPDEVQLDHRHRRNRHYD